MQRRSLTAVLAIAGAALLGVAGGYLLLVHLSQEAERAGRDAFHLFGLQISHPAVQSVILRFGGKEEGPVASLIANRNYSRFLLALCLIVLAAAASIFRQRTAGLLRTFFTTPTHAMNLAVFRIVVFGFAAFVVSREEVLLFAPLPSEFLVPPVGSGWLLDLVPVRPDIASWTHAAFVIATLAAALGISTRLTSVVALLLGFYVLGIPNFYGKVDHYNHLIWFMALLSVAPCSDTLSVDAAVRAWRSRGRWIPPEPSMRYALPLRLSWLLIGVCYFFPGWWKLADGGLEWALGDTFQTILHRQWAVPGFAAPFPLEQYPLLYRAAASTAVAFELGFVFLILFPSLRRIAVAMGLAFHNLTGLLMSIWFLPMQVSYVAFIDWRRVVGVLGKRVFPREANLYFDAAHPAARSLAAMTRHLDVAHAIRYEAMADPEAPRSPLAFEVGDRRFRGWQAWTATLARVPLAAFAIPALIVMGIPRKLDTTPAHSFRAPAAPYPVAAKRGGVRRVWFVGGTLLLVNGWFGAWAIERGWPFASYPTFATIRDAHVARLEVTKLSDGDHAVEVDLVGTVRHVGYPKVGPLLRTLIESSDARSRRTMFGAMHRIVAETSDDVSADDAVTFRIVRFSAHPEDRGKGPLDILLVEHFDPTSPTN